MGKIIALLTDFGAQDHYVSCMKGVILGICPQARIVDITHDVPAHDVRHGGFALWQASRWFPRGTIFVGVVDPGVGSGRRILAARTARHIFVVPDNGLLDFVASFEELKVIREVTAQDYFLSSVSSTFHGRDIFAPVAAQIALKSVFSRVGPVFKPKNTRPVRVGQLMKNQIVADIIYQDRYGNLITNIELEKLEQWLAIRGEVGQKRDLLSESHAQIKARIGRQAVSGICGHYAAIPKGQAAFVAGSTGLLEIACNGASAARKLKVSAGYEFCVKQT